MNFQFKYSRQDILLHSQAVLFSILFAIWVLPETILVRNLCLVLGASIGLYQIYSYRAFLVNKNAILLYLILALFAWITIHLLFLSNDFTLQYAEYLSVWKRAFIGVIFAIGFGLALSKTTIKVRKQIWIIFYFGLLFPTLIYILKFGLLHYEKVSGVNIGTYWHIYIAKTAYMGFCAPTLAIALGQIYFQIERGRLLHLATLLYLLTIPAVLFVFYSENIKNGVFYSFLFIAIFLALLVKKYFKKSMLKIGLLTSIIIAISTFFINSHIQKNRSWETFLADAKVAIQVENNNAWRVCGAPLGLPKNEFGEEVSDTNYSRIAWGINAAKLVIDYPMGYGLVERSFGHIGKQVWPDSCLSQSHSGWLDLVLGVGVPGLLLIIGALIIGLRKLILIGFQSEAYSDNWNSMLSSALLCLLFIWITTEISQKVFLEELLFFIALAGGTLAGSNKKHKI